MYYSDGIKVFGAQAAIREAHARFSPNHVSQIRVRRQQNQRLWVPLKLSHLVYEAGGDPRPNTHSEYDQVCVFEPALFHQVADHAICLPFDGGGSADSCIEVHPVASIFDR